MTGMEEPRGCQEVTLRPMGPENKPIFIEKTVAVYSKWQIFQDFVGEKPV